MRQRERIKIVPNEYHALHAYLSSGEDHYHEGCTLSLAAWRWYVTIRLPQWVLRPHLERHNAVGWDAATVARMGRDWYDEVVERRYGISLSHNHLNFELGRHTMDSSTEQRWGCFLPWGEWRQHRFSLYDLDGEHFWSEFERSDFDRRAARAAGESPFEAQFAAEKRVPKARFEFLDSYDNAKIIATTFIEEREQRAGVGAFRWLAWIRKPRIYRSLDIKFSAEVGPEKGSWKGGTVGHGLELEPGELHEHAFRRYCSKHKLVFLRQIGPLTAEATP